MNERIRWLEAQTTSRTAVYFPFTQGGLCSQLAKSLIPPLQIFEQPIGSLTLRVAQPNDAPYLEPLLRAYGEAPENYGDLEYFNEEKLPIVITNIANCLQHRYFITFLLFDGIRPIAFFQIDPYDIPTIQALFQQKLLPFWNRFFHEPLQPDRLLSLPNEKRISTLRNALYRKNLADYRQMYNACYRADSFLQFLIGSLQTANLLQQSVPDGHYIGNISYCLLPAYRRRGLMSQVLRATEAIVRRTRIIFLFSDRIAEKNAASVALLQRNGFYLGGSFIAFYGATYKTSRHPNGNFTEPCICCYKTLIAESFDPADESKETVFA